MQFEQVDSQSCVYKDCQAEFIIKAKRNPTLNGNHFVLDLCNTVPGYKVSHLKFKLG